jgi:hypothetical protein
MVKLRLFIKVYKQKNERERSIFYMLKTPELIIISCFAIIALQKRGEYNERNLFSLILLLNWGTIKTVVSAWLVLLYILISPFPATSQHLRLRL